ncbi:methionine--tRNA ligase subunit beta [Edaphobacter bradus]|uniref:methionine--tRNA ligase subunit beta n=1 Tax=Edaphobacter bradus TaxID=2259016 RepID=UPI0021DF7B62|nr:methionine--tRNA ligase subunit beta [Edaphobacter bradus]
MSEAQKKFYLTTPIYYVNARPHIGHAYTTIAADVIARRHRLLGDDTYFLTGTDEHGQKVQRSAAAVGVSPQKFTDEVSSSFQNLWKRMGITNDDFIRTTEPRHTQAVQKLFQLLYDRDAIYLSTYTGQYSVGEEMFVEGPPGTIGPDGKPTETVTEENYFFRLSNYQERLINLIESGELAIQPEVRKNEVLSFLRGDFNAVTVRVYDEALFSDTQHPPPGTIVPANLPADPLDIAYERGWVLKSASGKYYIPGALKDLSISRTSFKWGIPVPGPKQGEAEHVIYVWLDALANYMTAIGYGSDDPAEQEKFKKYWPADLHLVGKEIIRFHCVYWPAFLLAAGLPLPRAITAHGWLLFEESKMSKSRGNIVRTETILDAFGTLKPKPIDLPGPVLSDEYWKHEQDLFASDVLRYFLLREIPFGQDGSFSFDALIQRYNSDLANGYGNLVSRTLSMIQRYKAGKIPANDGSQSQRFLLADIQNRVSNSFSDCRFDQSLQQIWNFLGSVDQYISEAAPWKLAADESRNSDLETVLYTAAESIRIITALLYPVMPGTTAKVWSQLGLGDIEEAARKGELKNLEWGGLKPGTPLGPLGPIFPRADKGLIQLMTDIETNNASTTTKTTEPPAPAPQSVVSAPSAVAPATEGATETAPIAIDDFVKIELRVARVLVAERIPKADKLLRLEVDLGYEKRQILAGIAAWYAPEELLGRRIIIVANLAPRKMRGLESHGMLLAASHGEDGKPILATFADTDEIPLGSRLK